ncbi:MAG: hypothetical protein EOM80_02750 [Erysipelotrichia bacterium]|nr:hypothetical protein [Erysipelotrichia bacterium]
MQTGNETWKWGVVCILLAVFLIVANHAYKNITSQETFAPPDDYLQGDSWDIEHQSGPGAGQAMEMPSESEHENTGESATEEPKEEPEEQPATQDEIDWNKVKDPSEG